MSAFPRLRGLLGRGTSLLKPSSPRQTRTAGHPNSELFGNLKKAMNSFRNTAVCTSLPFLRIPSPPHPKASTGSGQGGCPDPRLRRGPPVSGVTPAPSSTCQGTGNQSLKYKVRLQESEEEGCSGSSKPALDPCSCSGEDRRGTLSAPGSTLTALTHHRS